VVILLTVTLGISIVGMVALILMKRYELSTGRIFLARSRPAIGDFFHRKLVWLEQVLPGLVRRGLRELWAAMLHFLQVGTAWVVLKIERGLEYALHRVRHTTTPVPPERGEETSAFLREVAEHKKKLQDELPDRGIVEE
jgi:hypothetical protein